jgi:hypothetical protein
MYGTAPEVPDALAVRSGHVIHRHYIVPAAAIGEIDDRSRVVGLTLRRSELQRFLYAYAGSEIQTSAPPLSRFSACALPP